MPWLNNTDEWLLIHRLSSLWAQSKAHNVPRQQEIYSFRDRGDRLYDKLFDIELARVFEHSGLYTLPGPNHLSTEEFNKAQGVLRRVCFLLDSLVQTDFDPVVNSDYPALKGLAERLDSLDSDGAMQAFDLTIGPLPKLFELPDDSNIKIELDNLTKWNNYLGQLSGDNRDEASCYEPKPKVKSWNNTQLRDQATNVLQILFRTQACMSPHEVKLSLSQGAEISSSDLPLHLWFLCSDSSQAQVFYDMSRGTVSVVPVASSPCEELTRFAGNNGIPRLMIQQSKVLNVPKSFLYEKNHSAKDPTESLGCLLSRGAFKTSAASLMKDDSAGIQFGTTSRKRMLAVKLGHCLMDFFDTTINPDNIYFTVSNGTCIHAENPYLGFTSGIPSSAELRIFQCGHPVFTSFAKLLLEIDDGEEILMPSPPPNSVIGGRDMRVFVWGKLVDVADKLGRLKGDDPYLEAVKGCLNVYQNITRSLEHREPDGKEADLQIREHIYVEVVENLERALAQSEPRPSNKRHRESSPPQQSSKDLPRSEASTMSTKTGQALPSRWKRSRKAIGGSSLGFFDDNTQISYPEDIRNSADAFLKDHQDTYEHLFDGLIDEKDRVKVAILDTGIDITHPSFQARSERIKDVRTWVDGLDGKQDRRAGDSSGHGTHVANLFLEVAPDCDVYIARIAKSDPIGQSEIAKVIKFAVDEWKVDIISMSFGFHHSNDELSAAILRAHANNILMFAAASNDGAHGLQPAYPARNHDVFCIYASDGQGNSSPDNPTARQHHYNFCTLGLAVKSAWPCALFQGPQVEYVVRRSGTSFSTPIAAGIAAILLLYARKNMPPDDALRLKHYDKMRDMLHYMSDVRIGYNVLHYISDLFDGQEREEALRATMRGIARGVAMAR